VNKREQKKQAIIGVARDIFARFGLDKTTMNEIARATRMGKATLYHYCNSKEQIFAEVINQESQILTNRLQEILAGTNSPQEQLRIYVLTRINYLNTLVNTYHALTDTYLENYASIKRFRQDFANHEVQMLESILQAGVDQKVFAVMKTGEVARIIGIALRGLELVLLTGGKSEISDDDINLITDIMLHGIC
jgi:AcrR family transcriptional regulator